MGLTAATNRFGTRFAGLFKPFIAACLSLFLGAAQVQAEDTIRIAVSNLPSSLGNPFMTASYPAIITFGAIFDALTWIDREGDVRSGLAVEWEPLNDTTWRVVLRPDVKFSNGEPFDAEAVAAAFEYLMSEDGLGTLGGREVAAIEAVSIIDPLTVEFSTKEPFSVFIIDLVFVFR